MLRYTYSDAYLGPLVTREREDRAVAELAGYGAFPVDWTERLVRLRAYVIVCAESQKSPEDLFSAKLKTYSREFEQGLPHARAAQDALGSRSGLGAVFAIPLERG